MARRREDRYPEVGALKADVESFLSLHPLSIGRYGPGRRLLKWIRRNRAVSAVAAVAAAAILLLTAFFVWRLELRRREAVEGWDAEEMLRRRVEADSLRSADLVRLRQIRRWADEKLWPALPDRVLDMETWIVEAEELLGRLGLHRKSLEEARRPAVGRDPANGEWLFARPEERWTHDSLLELVGGLEALEGGELPAVRARVAEALRIGRIQAESASLWEEAAAAIADPERTPAYGGLRIRPQTGLLPLGPDPDSGLWEFAHLASGPVPDRHPETRRLRGGIDMGIVLVLIPGGSFEMGSHEPAPISDERPLRRVALDPFFLSKFEMTQAQWLRVTGSNPSRSLPGESHAGKTVDLSHPVENATWEEFDRTLARIGLLLPTEAQWEYGARGGTTTVWWTGDDPRTIAGAANVADAAARRAKGPRSWNFEDWLDDGYAVHAPAGTYRPNPFGLHEVIGNVWEWCRDIKTGYAEAPPGPGDGERRPEPAPAVQLRVHRGGGFAGPAIAARSATRSCDTPSYKAMILGARPSRRIE